jgi:flavin reductase (DIM6/NTAB) family NADH-FMN oxidoreductase RutF
LSHLAGGVAVVTARTASGEPVGATATAVCSVSLEPPMVLACLDHRSSTHAAIVASGRYALSFLHADDHGLAERFARKGSDKFEGVAVAEGELDLPLLSGAIAHCECEVEHTLEAGDHTVFVGHVLRADVPGPGGHPLLYWRGRYGRLEGGAGPEDGA